MFAGGLGQFLEPVHAYCLRNNLPPLTALVVQKDTGVPGPGFAAAPASELGAAQASVFAYDWLAHGNPGVQGLGAGPRSRPPAPDSGS